MAKRSGGEVGAKDRFEVFKRDHFKCQYCGLSAPEVVLHLDHIKPKCEGGDNHPSNLVTSCKSCNLGKGPRLLGDNSALEKQRAQLEELQERRDQLDMMLRWREGLVDIEGEKLQCLKNHFETAAKCGVTEFGMRDFKKLIRKHDLNSILDAIDDSCLQYLVPEGDHFTEDSRNKALSYVGRILAIREAEKAEPYLRDLFYLRGTLRNRIRYCEDHKALALIKQAYLLGASLDELRLIVMDCRSWTDFVETIKLLISEMTYEVSQ